MRLFSLSTITLLGGFASSLAVLSLIAAGEESSPPKATERVADVTPAAFSTGDANASDSSAPAGFPGGKAQGHGPLNSNLSGERNAAGLDSNWSFDRIGSGHESDVFSGEPNPLPSLPVNAAMIPRDATDSAYPDSDAFPFPSLPASSGNNPNGSAKPASVPPATSGYFILVNGGQPGSSLGSGIAAPQAAPEPSSWALGGVAIGAFIYLRRRAARA